MQYSFQEYEQRGSRVKKKCRQILGIAIVFPYPQGYGLAKIVKQQSFAVMTALGISPEILLNQMRESSVYYHLVIDSDKCWANSDVSMMKKLSAKLPIMLPPWIKLPGEPQPTNGAPELLAY